MVEFLAGVVAEILDHTYIFESAILLQVMDAMGAQRQILFDLAIVGVPKLTVMAGIFDDDLVRADRLHSVIQAVARAAGFALNPVDGMGMHDRTRRPGVAVHRGHRGEPLQLLPRRGTEGA